MTVGVASPASQALRCQQEQPSYSTTDTSITHGQQHLVLQHHPVDSWGRQAAVRAKARQRRKKTCQCLWFRLGSCGCLLLVAACCT